MPPTVTEFALHPSEFFERRADRLNGFVGAFVAVVAALSTTLVLAAALWAFSQQFDGTTTIDNPAYPGDQFCGDEFQSMTPSGCSEPATRTVEVSSLLWDQAVEILPVAFVGLLVLWLLLAAALHAGALLGGAAWQASIWTAGLRVIHGLGRGAAVTVAVLTAAAPVLLG